MDKKKLILIAFLGIIFAISEYIAFYYIVA